MSRTGVLIIICLVFVSVSHAGRLLPFDLEVAEWDDLKFIRYINRIRRSVEIKSEEIKQPWRLYLHKQSTYYEINLFGQPVNYHLSKYDDTTIFMSLTYNPVINEPIQWPDSNFQLIVQVGNDHGHYRIIPGDSLNPLKEISSLKVETARSLPDSIVVLEFEGSDKLLPDAFKKLRKKSKKNGNLILLEQGYYKDLGREIDIKKTGRKKISYNVSNDKPLMALHQKDIKEILNDFKENDKIHIIHSQDLDNLQL